MRTALLTMLLVLCCVWKFGFGWQGFGAIVFTCYLVAASGIDLRTTAFALAIDRIAVAYQDLGIFP